VFLVAHEAGKVEIKQAVESLFKVSVADVRTITLRGKIKRLGRSTGKRPNWKKAVVSLAKGQTISQLDTV
jgi:large subunit ribosomal protein L23